MQCPICNTKEPHSVTARFANHATHVVCPQCGAFKLDEAARFQIERRNVDHRIISAWIRQQNDQGLEVAIESADVDRLAALPFPTFKERMENYLRAAARQSTQLESVFPFLAAPLLATTCCSTPRDLGILTTHLEDEGYLEVRDRNRGTARLTPKGHIYCDELRAHHAASAQGFIAMWFDQSMDAARRDGLELGIRKAGYKPHRVDDAQHIDKIDDRIIAEIRRSKFLVADLTEHRGGVYYEAGFAHGLGKPVFYTCRGDHSEAIHFDIRQFNYVKWDTPAELAAALQVRIEAVLGAGPELPG